MTNTWLFECWVNGKAFTGEHELMDIAVICKQDATNLATGPLGRYALEDWLTYHASCVFLCII